MCVFACPCFQAHKLNPKNVDAILNWALCHNTDSKKTLEILKKIDPEKVESDQQKGRYWLQRGYAYLYENVS